MCPKNKINDNRFLNNVFCGIIIDSAWESIICNNTIIDNYRGISIVTDNFGNRIYNNFLRNNINAYDMDDAYETTWNITKTMGENIIEGPYLGGNYWSDYLGADNDGDGLGDTPYNISGVERDIDYYPLCDGIPPEITNVSIHPQIQLINGSVNISINISCDVSDNLGVNQVWINITYPDGTIHNFSMNPGYLFNQTYSQIGLYQFSISANDTNGNVNLSLGHTFQIMSIKYSTFLAGLITDVNDSGGDAISFKAKVLLFVGFAPFSLGLLTSNEEMFVLRDFPGHLRPKFILGMFRCCSIIRES